MPVVCQFPLSLSECPDWPLEAEREPAERGNFSKCSWQTQCHISHIGLFPTCRYAESLPASRRILRTVGPADGSQSNHSVQRAGPVPPCTQDCCIYWSPRMMTSFPASQRGCCQNVPGSMSVPRVWQIKKVLTRTHTQVCPSVILFIPIHLFQQKVGLWKKKLDNRCTCFQKQGV